MSERMVDMKMSAYYCEVKVWIFSSSSFMSVVSVNIQKCLFSHLHDIWDIWMNGSLFLFWCKRIFFLLRSKKTSPSGEILQCYFLLKLFPLFSRSCSFLFFRFSLEVLNILVSICSFESSTIQWWNGLFQHVIQHLITNDR